jgi:hypothetical protein
MKQITLDWDTYQEELSKARAEGRADEVARTRPLMQVALKYSAKYALADNDIAVYKKYDNGEIQYALRCALVDIGEIDEVF